MYLENYSIIILLRFLWISFALCTVSSANIFHGIGMQMTNNGTGIYYKPGFPITNTSQIIADIGFHIDSAIHPHNYYDNTDQNRSILMEFNAGYRQELFKNNIVGTFRPVLIAQGGGGVDLNTLSVDNILSNWIFIYAVGTGFQFYNGRILNEIILKINNYFAEEKNISFQISLYWR